MLQITLPVIVVCFNPSGAASRHKNTRDQQMRLAATPGVVPYTVELAYGDAPFAVTSAQDAHHLQLRLRGDTSEPPLWHKTNLINLAVERLLPRNWQAYAHVDAEIIFKDSSWALQAAHMLTNGTADALQPFDFICERGRNYTSAAAWYFHGHHETFAQSAMSARELLELANVAHPGFSWAFNRKAHGAGLPDFAITGGDDIVISYAMLGGKGWYVNHFGVFGSAVTTRDWQLLAEGGGLRCWLHFACAPRKLGEPHDR